MNKSLMREFFRYVSLNILGMIALSFYILADTYFVSRSLGSTGIASLNLSISVYSVIHGVGLMIGIGGATRFSILKSNGHGDKGELVFSTAVKSGLIIGMAFALIGVFEAEGLARMLGADASTLPFTRIYLQTILSFAPFFILNNVVLAFVRNDDQPRLAMLAMLAGSLSNVVLDYIFIFPLGMGMFGAAFATGLAPVISLGILSLHFLKKNRGLGFLKRQLTWELVPDIFKLGSSAFILETSSAVVLFTFNLVILSLMGNLGVAAYGIVANLALVGTAIFTGLTQGIQPLTSRYHGLGDHETIRIIRSYAMGAAVSMALLIYGVIFFYSDLIIRVFNSEGNPQIADLAASGLKIYFMGFLFVGINVVTAMNFSATENARDAFFITISRGLLVIVPMVILLSRFLGMEGVWWSFVLTEVLVLFLAQYLMKGERSTALYKEAA